MKTFLKLFVIIMLLIPLISCDEIFGTDDDDTPIDDIGGEETVFQEISKEYSGGDITFEFTGGAKFEIKSSENSNATNSKVTIQYLKNERLFNTENDIVFDFSKISNEYYINFSFDLPLNLVEEDISLILYSPDDSEEILAAQSISFDYNSSTGKIIAKFKAPSDNPIGKIDQVQAGNKYSRLNLSWAERQKLADAPQQKKILMPYYEQPEGSCWATCGTMFARAYSPNSDRKDEIRIIDFVHYMGHSTLNEGIGLYAFKKWLPAAIKNYTDTETEVSSFVSKSNMLNEIIKKLDEDKPLIFSLDYPGVGGHAVLIVGYEIDLISAAKISIKLLIHNPNNTSGSSMYEWKDWDWLMTEKSLTEAFQILYAKTAVPQNRALQTFGMPINRNLGELSFVVQSGEGKEYSIFMTYDHDAEKYYKWTFPNMNDCDILPDSTDRIKLNLPIYNASESSKMINLVMKVYDNDNGELLNEISGVRNVSAGTNEFQEEISLDFINASTEIEARMKLEIWDGGTYLDGYTIYFKIQPKLEKIITYFCGADALYNTKCEDSENTFVDMFNMGASKINLKVSGKVLEGTSQEITTVSTMKITQNKKLRIEFDKEVNPTKIVSLDYELTSQTEYDGALVDQGHAISKLQNIVLKSKDKVGQGWIIEREGSEICDFHVSTAYTSTPAMSGGCSTELLEFRCESNSQFMLQIK